MRHRFWMHFLGKIGAPMFAATLVGCLLAERFVWTHAVLLVVGCALMLVEHRVLEG